MDTTETQTSQEVKQEVTSENKPARDEHGRLLPGNTANPNGRPPDTEQDKIMKKAVKEYIEELKQGMAEALPEILPVHLEKAKTGDMVAIKEVYDRVMGKPITPIAAKVEVNNVYEKYQIEE